MKGHIVLFALAFSGLALAQQLPAFDQVDKNHDGKITQDEAQAVEGLDFSKCDADQDGSLDQQEYQACTSSSGSEQ